MGRKLEPILTAEMAKMPTDTEYPCVTCSRLKSDGNCMNGVLCLRWRKWFGEAWQIVTKPIKEYKP